MKDYIRWDNSLCLSAGSGRVSHSVTIGVYNTLNRHNPFMLRFNESTRKWETVSLIPIMPNFCYSIKF